MKFVLFFLIIINTSSASEQKERQLTFEADSPIRIDEILKIGENIKIKNSGKNFIGILFHMFPGSFHLTLRRFGSNETTSHEFSNVDSMKYFFSVNKKYEEINIYAGNNNEHFSFSLFVSNLCDPDKDEILVTSVPNQTLVFKADNDDRAFALLPNMNKCVLIDSGGKISFDVKIEIVNAADFFVFNSHRISDSVYTATIDGPVLMFFNLKDINILPAYKIKIKYDSPIKFEHLYQYSNDNELLIDVTKAPMSQIAISSAVVSTVFCLFVVFIVFAFFHFKKINNNEDTMSSVYNDVPTVELAQDAPSLNFSDSGKNTTLNDINDNNIGDDEFDFENPPLDIYRIAKAKSLSDLRNADILKERSWSDMSILKEKSRNDINSILMKNAFNEESEENERDESDDSGINPYKVGGDYCM